MPKFFNKDLISKINISCKIIGYVDFISFWKYRRFQNKRTVKLSPLSRGHIHSLNKIISTLKN